MVSREVWRTENRLVLVDIRNDVVDLLSRVSETRKCSWDRLVDDLHRSATDQFLHLDESEVWLDAGGVTVHHETDRAGGCEH